MAKNPKLPRLLWLFWSQGAKQAPMVVKKCLRSWIDNNPGWKVVILDQHSVAKYIKPHPIITEPTHIQLAHRSDLIRLQLLYKYGGVWADATSYCIKPLDDWIDAAATAGFFAFHKPAADRLISNWFLASHKGNALTEKLYRLLIDYFSEHQEYPYFIFHYLFEKMVADDPKLAKTWHKMPKVSAVPPHLLFHAGLLNTIDDELKQKIERSDAPLFKLTWKIDPSLYHEQCVLQYLFDRFEKNDQTQHD